MRIGRRGVTLAMSLKIMIRTDSTGQEGKDNMPNGRGSMKCDHRLIQEGLLSKGYFVDGSDVMEQKGGKRSQEVRRESTGKKESGTSRGVKSMMDP